MKTRAPSFCLAALSLCTVLVPTMQATEWPDFRGPLHNGHVPDASPDFPTSWSESEHVAWKVPVHDAGHSSPVLWGDQIWLTTATKDGKKMYALAFDKRTGETLLDTLVFEVPAPRPLGNDVNTYASPSPVITEGRVFVHFGSYGTACFDTENFKQLWERRDLPCDHFRGPGSSPFLVDDLLILTMDGVDHQYLVALDPETGKTVWRQDRSTDWNDLDPEGNPQADGDFRKAYSTPIVTSVGDRRQLIAPGAKAAWAYDLRTGKEIWQVRYDQYSGASRPVMAGDLVLINSGFPNPVLYGVKLDPQAEGDLTESARIVWEQDRRMPRRSSPIVVDDTFYVVTDGGVCSAFDNATGKLVWSHRFDGQFSASPIYANGRLYFCNEQGRGYVLDTGKSFKKVAENTLETGLMACPASDGDALYLRSKTHLYRIDP